LGTLGQVGSYAYAINNYGQIVGYTYNTDGRCHAYLYSGGLVTDLGSLGGSSVATGINDKSQVVGSSSIRADVNQPHAFLYNDGVMKDLGTLGGSNSYGNAINDNGEIVGYSLTQSGSERAFIYNAGAMQDLNSMLPLNSPWMLSEAWAINDLGQVVAWGSDSSNQTHALLLTPIPEPSTLAILLTLAAGGMLWRKCRRT